MKKIFKLFVLVSLLFVYSCTDNADFNTTDQLTGTASEGGAIVMVNTNSDGKLLGAPSSLDLTTASVAFSDSSLHLEIMLKSGGQDISNYEIMKSLNGGTEVSVTSSPTLPITVDYTTLDEYISGLGVVADDLRIGDVISFKTKITKTDGTVYYSGPNDGTFNVTINCSSNLAGDYAWGTYQPSLTLEEVSAGVYRMPYLANFSSIYWFEFEDVCGELTITNWEFEGGNPITQNEPGYVDSDGSIVFPSVDVAGVSWFVGLELRYTKLN
jgi:hypothetical protein